ncbi:MAG: tagatose 1,6-diphosphate aldolase [bacterium]|nr:tagatose 1,6-diphosphate aldolase [bacterium]
MRDQPSSRGTVAERAAGLREVSSSGGVFAVLAVDHLGALASLLSPDDPGQVTPDELAQTKVRLVDALGGCASGVLIDPIIGLQPFLDDDSLLGSAGLMLALEDGDYATPERPPRLFAEWDVARAKKAGAGAVKCFFWYDPFGETDEAHQFVADLVADCRKQGIPLLAEPLSIPSSQADRRRVVVETARVVGALGPDVLKLEFPSNRVGPDAKSEWREACLELSEASPRPWTLLSAGTDFDTFAAQLEVACESGASGYVAGRAVWQNLVAGGAAEGDAAFAEARRRMSALTDIASGAATPWTHWYENDDRRIGL